MRHHCRKKILLIYLLLAVFVTVGFAQTQQEIVFDAASVFSSQETYGTPVHQDNDGSKHYLNAITGALLPHVIFMVWCRYIYRAGWAKVSWSDIADPRNRIPEWDTDWVWTNFAMHPFQGSLYYMAARNANLNRIESLAVTALGDFVWEYFYETQAPSINDLVYSFFGGFAIGEMMYRLSLEAEQKDVLFGYLLNPERIWSEPWLRQKPLGTVGNIYGIDLKVSFGTAHSYTAFFSGDTSATERFPVYMSPEFTVIYNDPYGHDSNVPYSQFEYRMGGAIGAGSGRWRGKREIEKYMMYDVFIFSNGMLLSRAPDWGENLDTTVGFIFDYDFRWHSLIDISSLAPGVAIKQRVTYKNSAIAWQAHCDVILLGITDYYYAHRDPQMKQLGLSHDYSYFIGTEQVLSFAWRNHTGWSIENNLHVYLGRDFAWQAQEGQSTGWEVFGFYDMNVEMPLSPIVRAGIGNQFYLKKAFYDHTGDVFQVMYSASVYAKLQFR